jgi:hypothetical protein
MRTLADFATVDALVARLASVRPDAQRRWGTMTPAEMLCHVADAFEVALGDRLPSTVKAPGPPRLIKGLALWLPIPWMKNVPTGRNVDPRRDGTRPGDFTADRDRAVRLLRRLAAEAKPGPHPIFGTMTSRDWLRWGFLHTDHHLRQFGL